MTDNISVKDAAGATKTVKTTDDAGVHTTHHIIDSGAVVASAGTNLNTSLLALESGGNLATLAGTVSSARAAVNLIASQAGITADAGAVAPNTPRVTLASDDPAVAYLSRLLSGALPTAGGAASSTTAQAVGGTYNGTPITLTDTQQAGIQLDVNGRLLVADSPLVTVIGAKADAKSTATDTTAVSLVSVLKQCSYSLQALVTALGGNLDLAAGTVGTNTQRVTIGTDDATAVAIQKVSASEYDDVAASTTRKLGGTGAIGDYLAGITIFPETTSPGAITLQDGNSTAVTIFAGGASSVSNLVPFYIPFGDSARTATTPGWTIVTLTNAHVRAHGNFT